jgi:hypothetical protein
MKSFDSISDFVEHLRMIQAHAELRMQHGLHEAGRMVQEEAQHEIGTYQPAAGEFPDWPALSENTLQGLTLSNGRHYPGKEELGFSPPDNPLKRTEQLKHAIDLSVTRNHAVVGVPNEHAGDGSPEDPFRNLGDVAVWMEFGTEKMPARSFLGRALFVKEKAVVSIIGHTAAAAVMGQDYHPSHDHSEI